MTSSTSNLSSVQMKKPRFPVLELEGVNLNSLFHSGILCHNPSVGDQGFYKGGKFVFSFKVGQGYPHDPPKVKCETMVYHPNIDLEGNVCLNILREDWKPVLTINSIIYGLQYLFLEPNPEDPLNKEAAEVLQNNRRLFEQNVQRSMRGGYIGSTYFERCLK
ncbi:NEDD8-conjugating enzyme Ubc12 [Scyliorhinus canicula]|uniref:NEDD8-conjugating enzyme Ubc12 n=1 Tax=Scyliorhinus canicula TaxID=7830 RepID=UPI0018F2BE68|nr:NEDD8-conjugating enzyme Ubc12 [Scyliorhinus canicula]